MKKGRSTRLCALLSVALAWALVSFAPPARAADADGTPAPTNAVVRQIIIITHRVNPSVIRKELAFREGEPFSAAAADKSRQNLHRLGLLKELEIDPQWDPALDGYKVTVRADDGWFLLPMPMIGSRGGESFAALMLVERNYFRRGEGLMAFASRSDVGSMAMTAFFMPRWSLMAGGQRLSSDKYQYADGAFNAKQFEDDPKGEEAGDFGVISNRYAEDMDKLYVFGSGRVSPRLQASAGFSHSAVSYHDPEYLAPDDTGDYNAWTLSLTMGPEGRGDPAMQMGALGAFGRTFGLGMAGVKEGLKPLPSIESSHRAQIALEGAETWLGSESSYTKGIAGVNQATIFRDRSVLSLNVKVAGGQDLPPSQKVSTSQRGLLTGVYAREYRGDSLAASSASYSHPFFRNILGMLNAEAFGDYAVCWDGDRNWQKEGAGFNLVYRFWRFPLPFGGGATYSFDDSNWQFSFAVGGMF